MHPGVVKTQVLVLRVFGKWRVYRRFVELISLLKIVSSLKLVFK